MSDDININSDKALIKRILEGDIHSFSIVVKNTEKLVAQIVNKMTSNEDDQKDLVQDIYLKVYQNLNKFQYKSKLSTWIANIAYNTTINYHQKKKLKITEIESSIANTISTYEDAETGKIKEETITILKSEIEKLPYIYKTLIYLYHIEILPIKEISTITELPEGTIKSYLSRARTILKDKMNIHYKI